MAVTLRALRRSRGLTLIDVARLSGVPARTLGAIELGALHLDSATRVQLACVFAVAPGALYPAPAMAMPRAGVASGLHRVALPFATALATTALAAALLPWPANVTSQAPITREAIAAVPVALAEAVREPALRLADNLVHVEAITSVLLRTASSFPASLAGREAGSPAPVSVVEAKDGASAMPRGCPVIAGIGQVVVTQGYAEGSHAPASIWGALDFGIDADGDGYAEPGATRGAMVIATHAGIARVYPGSWPGGHFVRIENHDAGWNTAYGHLDTFTVNDGQEVQRGTVIGTVGSTGYATGPHLHYEIWHQGVNVDPGPYVACD
ncbi:MAG: peptidoglycan DD-metalloendopeptidase family protein [Chloroflexi bacterium]|nr:peptidoglycan DD-metalloendopeptidase family protein [Chloroflexota bacterium]